MKVLLLKIAIIVFGRFSGLRENIIKALLLSERKKKPEDALRWLLSMSDFVSSEIDFHCIKWGDGVHVKHELMTGIHSFYYDRIPEGTNVLDVGCGVGAVSFAIAEHTQSSVIGIDFNKEQIEFAQERFKHRNLRFMVGDALQDLPPEAIDVIVMSSVLEHIDDRPALLRALVNRYHPSCILIRVPGFERHYYAALKRKLGLFAYTDPDHKIEYITESFLTEVNHGGLHVKYMEVRWGDIWAECVPLSCKMGGFNRYQRNV